MILVGCGAAGAIAGIFKAPIAGILFVIEVLARPHHVLHTPLLVTAVTATTVSYILNGMEAMFAFSQVEPFTLDRIPFVILLGIVCGFLSLYVVRSMTWCEGKFAKLPPWKRFLWEAAYWAFSSFLSPLYGEGYNTINTLLAGGDLFQSLTSESLSTTSKAAGPS